MKPSKDIFLISKLPEKQECLSFVFVNYLNTSNPQNPFSFAFSSNIIFRHLDFEVNYTEVVMGGQNERDELDFVCILY